MTITRRAWLEGLVSALGLAAMAGPAAAQAGYPPPPPGIAPPGYADPTRQHFDILRQQESDRRSFDAFQRSQQRETDRNLETLRRQQSEQRRALDAMRREGRTADEARTSPRLQVQGRRPRRPLTDEERLRIDRAARSRPVTRTPSILIEDPPPRRRRRRTRY